MEEKRKKDQFNLIKWIEYRKIEEQRREAEYQK